MVDAMKSTTGQSSQLLGTNSDSDTDNILLKDYIMDDIHQNSDEHNELNQSRLRKVTHAISLPYHVYGGKEMLRKNTFLCTDSDNESSNNFSDEKRFDDDEEDYDAAAVCINQNYNGDPHSSEMQESQEIYCKSTNKEKHKEKLLDLNIYSNVSKNIVSDVKKGAAIKNQLGTWESLLECRIKLQKALVASNNLPSTEIFSTVQLQLDSENQLKLNKCQKILLLLLHKMEELQKVLVKQCQGCKTRNVINSSELIEESLSDESELEENKDDCQPPSKKRKLTYYSNLMSNNHANFIQFRNSTIQKWNDKTKVSTGKISNSNFSAFDHSTLKQIEQIMANKERLINRTRIKRNTSLTSTINSQGEVQEDSQEVAMNAEIFDDTDFYHKLLRDFIERKSFNDTNSSQTERQMIELQKLRSKMKKNVDTKSTKGRKLRYVVIPKLVNFMAPDSYTSGNEHTETNLYNSLFGKLPTNSIG